MTTVTRLLILVVLTLAASVSVSARQLDVPPVKALQPDADVAYSPEVNTLWNDTLPSVYFMPLVYDHFEFEDAPAIVLPEKQRQPEPWQEWLIRAANMRRAGRTLQNSVIYSRPDLVRYNAAWLPEVPQQYHMVVNPATLRVDVEEFTPDPNAVAELNAGEIRRKYWIHDFAASLQFSQAYVSPNWYQGGNNNLVVLGQVYWNVKLNQAYHPNLLFESTVQYKLGTNSAPDDSIHSYNISEDVLQITSTFGVKAFNRWYYSITGLFKTQLLNSYGTNSTVRKAGFLSPGELNLGIGMTYGYTNKRNFTFDASISPLSYNLRTCISDLVDHAPYDIAPDRKTVHKFGSSSECKLSWKIAYNITLASRLFMFTDYSRFESDWENTLAFEINRFLTTQIYAHLRYDTSTPRTPDPNWHKLQVKEILSIGFAYKFGTKP